MKKLLILVMLLTAGLTACNRAGSGGFPGGVLSGTVRKSCGVDNDSPGCKAVEKVLSWFTESIFRKVAPMSYPGSTGTGGANVSFDHTQCYCKYGEKCGANDQFYTYDAFVKVLKVYPEIFIDTGTGQVATEEQQKRIMAAIFAIAAQEVGGSWPTEPANAENPKDYGWSPYGGLCYLTENGKSDKEVPPASETCGYDGIKSPSGYCYHGRGIIQLTYQYNYANFSQAFFGNDKLVRNPELVSSDPVLTFATALDFFANYQKDSEGWRDKPKGLSQYMVNPREWQGKKRDFAYIIYLVNGGIECTAGYDNYKARNRVYAFTSFYRDMTGKTFNESENELNCKDMTNANDISVGNAPLWKK